MRALLKLTLTAAVVAFTSQPAAASDAGYGQIYGLVAYDGGNAFAFRTTGTRTTLPACASAVEPKIWVIDVSTDNGKAQVAALLTLFAQGKPVGVRGTGTCLINYEKPGYFYSSTTP